MTPPIEVSVIVPAKDRESFVAEAVRSALGQEGCRLEVIVVDDGSRDGTRAAVRAIADGRVRLLDGPGRGPAAARNAGLRVARAPLVAFLDSDDVFEPAKLARQIARLDARPDAGLAYTGHAFFGDAARRAESGEPGKDGADRPDGVARLWLRPYFLTSSVVVRRSLLDRVGAFDESLPLAEDYDLYLRCAAVAGIAGEPGPLVRIRRHAGNLTAADRLALAYRLKRVVRRHRAAAARALPPGDVARRLAHVDYAIGALLLERGEARRARGYFARARAERPLWVKAWKGTVAAAMRG